MSMASSVLLPSRLVSVTLPLKGAKVEVFLANCSFVARAGWRLICMHAEDSIRDGLRSRLERTRVLVMLWVQQWDIPLYPILASVKRFANLRAASVRAVSREFSTRTCTGSSRQSTSARTWRRQLSWRRSIRRGLRRRRDALGTWRRPQRLMRGCPGSPVRWSAFTMEGSTGTVQPCILHQPQAVSFAGRLAGVCLVGQRTQPGLRIWQRIMGTDQATCGRDSALCGGRSWSRKRGPRRPCCSRLQQWMVPQLRNELLLARGWSRQGYLPVCTIRRAGYDVRLLAE